MRRRIMAVAVAVAVVAVCAILWHGFRSSPEAQRRPVPEQKRDPPHKAAGNGGYQGGQPSDEADPPPADD